MENGSRRDGDEARYRRYGRTTAEGNRGGAGDDLDRSWLIDCLFDGGVDSADMLSGDRDGHDSEALALLQSMLDETMDMLESPNFMACLCEGLDASFSTLEAVLRERDLKAHLYPHPSHQLALMPVLAPAATCSSSPRLSSI